MIAPHIEEMSKLMDDVVFLKVGVVPLPTLCSFEGMTGEYI